MKTRLFCYMTCLSAASGFLGILIQAACLQAGLQPRGVLGFTEGNTSPRICCRIPESTLGWVRKSRVRGRSPSFLRQRTCGSAEARGCPALLRCCRLPTAAPRQQLQDEACAHQPPSLLRRGPPVTEVLTRWLKLHNRVINPRVLCHTSSAKLQRVAWLAGNEFSGR